MNIFRILSLQFLLLVLTSAGIFAAKPGPQENLEKREKKVVVAKEPLAAERAEEKKAPKRLLKKKATRFR